MVTEPQLHNPCGGNLSLDFANSVGRSVTGFGTERLTDYAALVRWCEESGTLPAARGRALLRAAKKHPSAATEVFERAIDLREAIFETFHSDIHESRPPRDALETLNTELANALSYARVAPADGGFTWTWSDAQELDAPLWPIARAAADLLASDARERVKVCASDTCLWLFLDRTRNHGRRWCEMKGCGNLAKVRRFRGRRKRS